MYKNLYDCFKHWYTDNGTIYLYSDPHFSDVDSYKFRFPEEFNFEGCENRLSDEWIVERLDKLQIKNINKVCGKNDTLIILGDVGNIECVKKLKARYKVLILGNHDSGASNYLSKNIVKNRFTDAFEYETIDGGKWYIRTLEDAKFKFLKQNLGYNITEIKKHEPYGMGITEYYITGKENLFDEVYEGTLQISPKIILSHEPVDYKYLFNLHGHVHTVSELGAYTEKIIDGESAGGWYNCCAEQINYTPISLNALIKSGMFSAVPDIHRETIKKASLKNS